MREEKTRSDVPKKEEKTRSEVPKKEEKDRSAPNKEERTKDRIALATRLKMNKKMCLCASRRVLVGSLKGLIGATGSLKMRRYYRKFSSTERARL